MGSHPKKEIESMHELHPDCGSTLRAPEPGLQGVSWCLTSDIDSKTSRSGGWKPWLENRGVLGL